MEILLYILIGFAMGWSIRGIYTTLSTLQKNKKIVDDIKYQYKQILDNIVQRKSTFKSRINQTVYVSTTIKNYGDVDLLYLMDKKDIGIFKDNKCLYTSYSLDKKLKNDIITSIRTTFNKEINEVFEVMGVVFSKIDFEKTFKMSPDDFKKQQTTLKNLQEENKSDIQKIIESNEKKLSLDDILEKIGKVGYDNLSTQEKEFLKNMSK